MADLKPPSTERPIEDLTYEQARDELVTIVSQLEAGQLPLEDSLRLWERGEALAAHCSTWLDQAEARPSGNQRRYSRTDLERLSVAMDLAAQGHTGHSLSTILQLTERQDR